VKLAAPSGWADPVPWAAVILIALAVLMLIEAVRALCTPAGPGAQQAAGTAAGTVPAQASGKASP
jgi:hypothetical protein